MPDDEHGHDEGPDEMFHFVKGDEIKIITASAYCVAEAVYSTKVYNQK